VIRPQGWHFDYGQHPASRNASRAELVAESRSRGQNVRCGLAKAQGLGQNTFLFAPFS
jgi:hypothetical protein